MSTTDLLSLLALVVAIGSFIFAWVQYHRPADITVFPTHVAWLSLGLDHNLQFSTRVVFVNDGAQYGPIVKATMLLARSEDSWSETMHWHHFETAEEVGEKGKELKTHFTFEGYASVLVVPGRQAFERGISFSSRARVDLRAGSYVARIDVDIAGAGQARRSQDSTISLNDKAINFLEKNCTTDPVTRIHADTLEVDLN